MAGPGNPGGKQLARDLSEGEPVDTAFIVRERELRSRRGGGDFLTLVLGDVSGTVEGVVWEDVASAVAAADQGAVVRVAGTYSRSPRYGSRITVRSIARAGPGDVRLDELVEASTRGFGDLEREFRTLIASVSQPELRQLLERLLGPDSDTWKRFSEAPAAKLYHQAYRRGLLEHTLTVAQGVSAVAQCFSGIDRDVAVTGALVHDLGKIDAYTTRRHATDLTDAGRLQGEIPLGYYRVRREIEEIPGFPGSLAKAILHVVLAHHGSLENGSPVPPLTREATVVHMIDNLGGRLGSFDRLEGRLPEGECWSPWDRALEGAAYFASRAADPNGSAGAPGKAASPDAPDPSDPA